MLIYNFVLMFSSICQSWGKQQQQQQKRQTKRQNKTEGFYTRLQDMYYAFTALCSFPVWHTDIR